MKNNIFLKVLALTFIIVVFNYCTYDKEDDLNVEIQCDTFNVSYTNSVLPILETNCVSCHNGPSGFAGVDLSNYTNVRSYAESGLLMGVIRHEDGYSPMPRNQSKLDDCSIRKLEIWIENGTLDN